MIASPTTRPFSPLLYDRAPRRGIPVARRGGPLHRAARAVAYLLDIPRRHAALSRLVSLSDGELAARGLTRDELTRVFDPDFTGFSHRA